MRKDAKVITRPVESSFLSCKKDAEILIRKLFVESGPNSDMLKRLLVINEPDCKDESIQAYTNIIDNMTLSKLRQNGYIRLNPKISRGEHEEIKSYILFNFVEFSMNAANPAFRDAILCINIICYEDAWELDDYEVRPIAIAGYIDGILNSISNESKKIWYGGVSNIKLSGMGVYQLMSCKMTALDEGFGIYTMTYYATHFTEDIKDNEP